MSLYETVKGVLIVGTYVDLHKLREGSPSPKAMDMAQDYVLSLPKEWLPYIQHVVVDEYFKTGNFGLAVFNNLPEDMLEKLIAFTTSKDWEFWGNIPISAKRSNFKSPIIKATLKSVRFTAFNLGQGEHGKEFPIEEFENEEEKEILV